MIAATLIDGHAVLQLVWTAVVASVLVCGSFGLAVRWFSSATATRRAGRPVAAVLYALAAAVPALACAAAIAVGVLVLVSG